MRCEEKRKYRSEADALVTGARAMRKSGTRTLRAYVCRKCGHWHLTHREN